MASKYQFPTQLNASQAQLDASDTKVVVRSGFTNNSNSQKAFEDDIKEEKGESKKIQMENVNEEINLKEPKRQMSDFTGKKSGITSMDDEMYPAVVDSNLPREEWNISHVRADSQRVSGVP